MNTPDNPQAFPKSSHYPAGEQTGMSLRDWFAGMALQSLVKEALDLNHERWTATAQHAYLIAEAMLKQRQQLTNYPG